MRKTKKAARASTKSRKAADTPLKASSLSELRDLQRQAGAAPAASPTTQAKQRPHRFLPPRPGPVTPATDPGSDRLMRSRSTLAAAPPSDSKQPGVSAPVDSNVPTRMGSAAMSADNPLSQEDIALFRRVVQSVTPRPKSDRLVLAPVPPAAPAQLRQRRQLAMGQTVSPALDVSDHYASGHLEHDDTVFLQTGQGPHLIKGLKKGKWPVQASLDLHGSTLDDARERMDRFIQSCRDHDIRCVRIVHGKGYGSKDGNPVLKETVRRWLSQLAVVQAYIESDEVNGGAGAVLVLLNKVRR